MKKSKFFCDIVGTYTGSEENRKTELKKFVNNLNELAQIDEVDEMVFSFISSEDIKELLSFISEIAPYFKGTKVKLGEQYSDDKILKEGILLKNDIGKSHQILNNILPRNYFKIYYADDTLLNHTITKKIISIKKPEIEVVSFIPGHKTLMDYKENKFCCTKKNINGLNLLMEKYITHKKTDKLGKKII